MHSIVSLVSLVLMSLGMGVLIVFSELPRAARVFALATCFVAAVTCGIIIGRLM